MAERPAMGHYRTRNGTMPLSLQTLIQSGPDLLSLPQGVTAELDSPITAVVLSRTNGTRLGRKFVKVYRRLPTLSNTPARAPFTEAGCMQVCCVQAQAQHHDDSGEHTPPLFGSDCHRHWLGRALDAPANPCHRCTTPRRVRTCNIGDKAGVFPAYYIDVKGRL